MDGERPWAGEVVNKCDLAKPSCGMEPVPFIIIPSFNSPSPQPHEDGAIILLLLQMSKLRHREATALA